MMAALIVTVFMAVC